MADSAAEDRTEEASARRLEQARERGQVPRSRELVSAGLVGCGVTGMLLLGPTLAESLGQTMRQALQRAAHPVDGRLPDLLGESLGAGALAVLPMVALLGVIATGASIAVGGWNFTLQGIEWRAERVDPLKGLSRLFSSQGLIETGKGLLKVIVIGAFGVATFRQAIPQLPGLALVPLPVAMPALVGLCLTLWGALALGMGLIALLDVPLQRWQYARQLRMTRHELREEHKEMEGRPEVRGRIRQLQRERGRRRMMEQVPLADVVLTNPTHYAVALRYDAERMRAPVVVAKGADRIALRIRAVAAEHGVLVLESPSLARALYWHAALDEPIPVDLYLVVAQVLAYVYQLKHQPHQMARLPELEVPASYRVAPDAESDPSALSATDEWRGGVQE
ncbi:MAG TPA: flagellar biosynthesis protein FlhB [Candidatus Acidoferrales bacterium]|nr:flagellar biosynthesis protein FlhB [Candidatus Acidoferrales bacterium]